MSESSLALVKRYFESFNAGNAEGMLSCVSESIAHDVNQGGRRSGKALFAEFLAHTNRCYKERLEDMVIMVSPDGKRASAEYVVHGQYLASDDGLPPAKGQRYKLPAGSFFEISDHKICRVTTYYNLQNWIDQVAG